MQSTTAETVRTALSRRGRWGLGEIAFWLVAAATLFFLPERHLILNEIAIIGLFALSLDLILGYAGIVSLGHAAFFGLGAYVAGILARNGMTDPLAGLVVAAIAGAILGFITSFLVLRGVRSHQADGDAGRCAGSRRIGQPDVLADRRGRRPPGHHHGADPRAVRVRHLRHDRLCLQPRA